MKSLSSPTNKIVYFKYGNPGDNPSYDFHRSEKREQQVHASFEVKTDDMDIVLQNLCVQAALESYFEKEM